MRVTVFSRDGDQFMHQAPDVRVSFEEDHVEVVEESDTPSGTSWQRTHYLREAIVRIVEHDFMPEDKEGEAKE
jgi:hypothetical protein